MRSMVKSYPLDDEAAPPGKKEDLHLDRKPATRNRVTGYIERRGNPPKGGRGAQENLQTQIKRTRPPKKVRKPQKQPI